MKRHILRFTALILLTASFAQSAIIDIPRQTIDAAFARSIPAHPRLFLTDDQLPALKQKIAADSTLNAIHTAIIAEAEALLSKDPLRRIKTGRRLLSVSRECIRRTMFLSYAWRTTRRPEFLQRCEKEMLTVAGFSDWNPSHFLDVAEMTTALAIGYDWTWSGLSPQSRQKIAAAILNLGIKPSLDKRYNGFVHGRNNWNQVCHGGITLGALALLEDQNELARMITHRAANNIQIVMDLYEPDGAYPEGPGYWSYGTSYNVILFAAFQSVLNTTFDLDQKNGFSQSADYFIHVNGPIGKCFNYPDSGSTTGFVPAVFWYGRHYHNPSITWSQYQYVKNLGSDLRRRVGASRFAPLALVWADKQPTPPAELSWMGRGPTPVAMFRQNWTDSRAVWLAIKGGSPGVSHGHMDVGSFVLDAAGLRWAADLGPENYNRIEQMGINLWGFKPDSPRWKIFRYNNFSHNTLVVNGQYQQIKASAPIVRYSDADRLVVIDLTDIYKDQLASARRGARILPSGQILIQDEIKARDQSARVRWAMVTPAKVKMTSDVSAQLQQKGQTLDFKLITTAKTKLQTWSTEPREKFDAPNGDTRLIGFEVQLEPSQSQTLQVVMTPPAAGSSASLSAQPLLTWPSTLTHNH